MYYYVNKMKKIIPVILLVLSLAGCYNSGEPRERILKIYNWADYIGDSVLEDFQACTDYFSWCCRICVFKRWYFWIDDFL